MEIVTENNTYLSLKDKFGRLRNEQILIVANSGGGKSVASEGIAEKFYKNGFVVIIIADPKREVEWGYQMFEPIESYHLKFLSDFGIRPTKKKVKLYHPFSFNIPKEKIPDINFFTLPLKNFGRKEWSLLAETGWDTETMRLLLNASNNITKEDGIFGLLHYIQSMIKGKKEGKTRKPDPKSFYLESGSGTMKSVAEISNYLQPFKRDYLLTKDNCSINLKWEEFLNDKDNYHVFMYNWIDDEKTRDFVVLALLEGILRHKDILKYPLLIVIPEIRKLCPFKPQGHKVFLAQSIKDSLSLIRSSGRGMSSLLDSQVWQDIDDNVKDSATETFFGRLGGGDDMEKVAKAYNYKRDIRDQLKSPDYPFSYLRVGKEDMGGWTFFLPSSMHGEEKYRFIEMYKKNYYNKMRKYDDLIKTMKKIYKEEEDKIKDKVRRKEKEEQEEADKKIKEKEDKKNKSDDVEKVKGEVKELKEKEKEQVMIKCWEMHKEGKKFREIGRELGINHITAKRYFDKIEKIKEKEADIDFEDNFVKEFEEEEEVPPLSDDFDLPEV